MPTIDDYVERLKSKDDEAFEYLYNHTKRGVYAIIIAIVKDHHATEDLMQETYIKMLKRLNQYEPGRNFNAWITQIAKNIALDYYRKHRQTQLVDPIEDASLLDQTQVAQDQTDYSLEEMLLPLEDLERQIVLLRTVSETKFKNIAEIVDKPLGTVLWIYQRAIQKMKKSLERSQHED